MWFIFAFRTSRAANASLRRGRAATRVEVSLGGAWRADSTRVWVRNSRGDLERLAAGERVIAFDQPMSRAAVLPTIRCSSNLTTASPRSEEHTSELQSPCNLVCRLLLEKKKTK